MKTYHRIEFYILSFGAFNLFSLITDSPQRLEGLLPSFELIENLSVVIDYFWLAIEEFLDLGILDGVDNFNDFILAILNNLEQILITYPNFEGSLSDLKTD